MTCDETIVTVKAVAFGVINPWDDAPNHPCHDGLSLLTPHLLG